MPLYLDVTMNGRRIGKIAEFVQMPDGSLACRPAELAEIGIAAPVGNDPIPLSTLAGVTARYDAQSQTIAITVAADSTTVRKLRGREETPRSEIPSRADWGMAANYVFFAGASQAIGGNWSRRFDGASLTLDSRFSSPFGTLSQSAILGATTGTQADAVRLGTTFTHVDEDRSVVWRAGDVISGGLAWTRPVRLGGAQVQKNFSLRSDLVTLPLPALSGTAAVPSTVDVWINDQKVRSIDGVEGRFEVADIPMVTGSGEARLVVRDATGRAVENKSSFYVSPTMLRGGLWDFSVEAGAPRTGYGVDSGRYHADETFLSWTLRDGLANWMTVEGHGEFARNLQLLGGGAVFSVFGRGAITAEAAVSRTDKAVGRLWYLDGETRFGRATIHVSTQRTLGRYEDIASLSADEGFRISSRSCSPARRHRARSPHCCRHDRPSASTAPRSAYRSATENRRWPCRGQQFSRRSATTPAYSGCPARPPCSAAEPSPRSAPTSATSGRPSATSAGAGPWEGGVKVPWAWRVGRGGHRW